jgi:thymidine kinase
MTGRRVPSGVQLVEPDELFAKRVRPNVRFVALDEAQFFLPAVLTTILDLVFERGVTVVAAGLSRDFRGEPFGAMPTLLAFADEIVSLTAVCHRCKSPNATMTGRLGAEQDTVLVGARERYEALCRWCWSKTGVKSG